MTQRDRGESSGHKVVRRARWLARRVDPDRAVTRTVQGVALTMPRLHRLADYTEVFPEYGQNVVRLAKALAPRSGPLRVVDVGANIGDTARQILDRVDARVLCVEGDPYWLPWLERNAVEEMEIAAGLLTVSPSSEAPAVQARRRGGTTRFVASSAPPSSSASRNDPAAAMSVNELYDGYPDFHGARLVKSDTDGSDVVLAPALAAAWRTSRPVLFLEYDESLSRDAGHDPGAMWPALAALGYDAVAVWDHVGQAVGTVTVDELCRRPVLAPLGEDAPYWDVAVAHRSDPAGRAALATALDPQPASRRVRTKKR